MSDHTKLSQRMKADWDRRVAHDYRFWMSDGYQSDAAMWEAGERDLKIITEGIAATTEKTLLDLGCGVGRLVKAALPHYERVIGIDVSEAAINKAATLIGVTPHLSLFTGNGLDLHQIEDSSVDVVISFAALVSMPAKVTARYFREMHRVLRTGGVTRLQLYLGEEQLVTESDTLHLRCFKRENFEQAVSAAGFSIDWIKELVLPIQVSFKEAGIEAFIVSLTRDERAPTSVDAIAALLLPGGEECNESPQDRDLEYWMTVNYASQLADRGEIEKAKRTLEFAATVSETTTLDVRDLLERIVSKVEGKTNVEPLTHTLSVPSPAPVREALESFFDENFETLKRRFPRIAAYIDSEHAKGDSAIETKVTPNGAVLFRDGQPLDHPEKPIAAAEGWCRRLLQDVRLREAGHLCLVGFGSGYHVEALQAAFPKMISVIEPDAAAFAAALASRDLRECLDKLHTLEVGTDTKHYPEDAELVVRPQTQALFGDFCTTLRAAFYGSRGLSLLHPTVGLVGPLQGGTLPMTAYTLRALQMLKQKVREFDMSGFAGGYHHVEKFFFDSQRKTALQNAYLESISYVLLESANEKPVDILICMAQAPISGRVLMELRKRGVITVLWFVEDYLRFTYWQELGRYYDFVFTIQKGECLDAIKAAGAGEVHYLPPACDPGVHVPMQLSAEDRARWGSPISFVGAGYHNRQQVFATFAEMPFKIWGTEWPECRPFDRLVQEKGRRLTPAEYVKIFNATDININLHSSTERDGVEPNGDFINPRTFELAAAGAFQLVDERTLLGDMFEAGKEVATFKDPDDLRRKVQYYLAHPEERKAIAQRGRERALRDHTYEQRIRQMLSIIYNSKFEQLKRKQDNSPWNRMLERSAKYPELHERCKTAYTRGEEPNLDGLLADIVAGKGKLSETEKKLLFLFHVRKQIIRMTEEEKGGKGKN